MKSTGKLKTAYFDAVSRKHILSFEIDTSPDISKLSGVLDIEAKKHRERRSLDANAYLWVLLQKIAVEIGSDKWTVYLEMLKRYGKFTHVIVKPNVVERVKQEWRATEEVGEVTVNGQTGIQLRCYFGSHTYNTKEMSVLIDGVVHEAKELGIETLPPDELKRMKGEWNT